MSTQPLSPSVSSHSHSGAGARLELRLEDGVPKHYLNGRAIEPGTRVDLLLPNGRWISGVYEWSGVEVRWPILRFEIGGAWEQGAGRRLSAATPIPPEATLRLSP